MGLVDGISGMPPFDTYLLSADDLELSISSLPSMKIPDPGAFSSSVVGLPSSVGLETSLEFLQPILWNYNCLNDVE